MFYKIAFYVTLSMLMILSVIFYNNYSAIISKNIHTIKENGEVVNNRDIDDKINGEEFDIDKSSGSPVIVFIDVENNNRIVYVDGKEAKYSELLQVLAKPLQQRGRETELIIVSNREVPYDQVSNMWGIANKVGFQNILYYMRGPSTRKVLEINNRYPEDPIPESYGY